MGYKGLIQVVDDEDVVRQSLEAMLGAAGYEVRVYARAEDFIEAVTPHQMGCVVSDVRMPGMDGLSLLRRLRAEGNGSPVVLMTGHGDIALAVAAMKAGAADFIEKPFETEEFLAAIHAAMTGAAVSNMGKAQSAQSARQRLAELTPREHEVLERLVAGRSNKQAAAELGLSSRTVEFHRAHILAKTGARGVPDLVRLWLEVHS